MERRGESHASFAAGGQGSIQAIATNAKGTDTMPTRTTKREVVFLRPFILDGMDAVQPAGTYTVETEEESLDTMLSPAWKRLQTSMIIVKAGQTEYLPISPEQLHEALMRDGAQQDPAAPRSPDSAKALRSRARDMRHPSRNRS